MKKCMFFAVTAVMFMAMVLVSCSSDSTPSDVVKSYYKCMKSGDVEKAVSYMNVSEERAEHLADYYKKRLDSNNANDELMKKGNVSIASESIDGEEAEVIVMIEHEGMEIGQPMYLVKVDGKWKIKD